MKPQAQVLNVYWGSRENAEFSNLAPRPFTDKNGTAYASVEHAYQTWKGGEFNANIYNLQWTPGRRWRAPVAAQSAFGFDDWPFSLMYQMMLMSFEQNPQAAQRLVETGDAVFTHVQDKTRWREDFPKALTMVREELKRRG